MSDEPSAPKRRGNPNFVVGAPGGPGRPKKIWTAEELMKKKIRQDLKEVAKDHTHEAFTYLLSVLRNDDANTKDRMNAATQILERGWGKPTTQQEIKVDLYQNMSDGELIKLITGREIDVDAVNAVREPLTIEHEAQSDDDISNDDDARDDDANNESSEE